MKTIKVKFVDFWNSFDYNEFYLYKYLKKHYDVVITNNPDYVIFGDHGYEHLKYDCIRIYCTVENMVPNFNQCDYAIGFNYLDFEDRYIRCPIYFLFDKYIEVLKLANQKHIDENNVIVRDKFCNMVVSNGLNGMRNTFFHDLSKYKQVDSGGKILNNVGGPVKSKLEFQKKYKFSLAFENSSSNGYTTEKIIDAFASGGIPIYWGDPLILKVFNPKSFINANDFNNTVDLINFIQKIDNDDDLYLSYIKEPCFNDNNYIDNQYDEFDSFLKNIFDQELENAKRRCPENHWVNMEKKYYLLADRLVKSASPLLKIKAIIKNKLIK